MKKISFFLLGCGLTLAFASKADKLQQAKEAERKQLQVSLETARDSLQLLITRQYAFKQQTVEQREANKEELDKKRELLERAENDLVRIKEERLSREQQLENEHATVKGKLEEWDFLSNQIKDIFQKDADGLIEKFPLDKEAQRLEIEKVRTSLSEKRVPAKALTAYVDYRLRWFRLGDSVSIGKAVVVPEEGNPTMLTIARFGNMLGYGLDSATGHYYYLRQTGRLGAEKYAVEKIASPQIESILAQFFPKWLQDGFVSGSVPIEVMQNDQARMLIAGKQQTAGVALYESFAKGGWVMIPMLLLPFWVLFLCLIKIGQFTRRGRLLKKQFQGAMSFLEKKDFAGALAFSQSCKSGVMARIVQSCLERRQSRDSGERATYELLALEAPPLRYHLNTLAVIAGAAPLLGLLGTISGMITLFAAVTHYGTGDPKFLAGGISEALITAKTGLAIAIPVLFIHDLLRGAKDRLMANMESYSISILNAIYPEV